MGARSDLGVLLTTWKDDLDDSGRFVRVLRWPSQGRSSSGRNERMDHLRALWSGGLAGYAVIAVAQGDEFMDVEEFIAQPPVA
ncbi:hypothetical protein [Nitrosovibrio sp. Nv17]|uniref:hypothetical protein n=1 Tax=Nitrosovibrio sp. Nv17 TaxID=1855339 RepID=UPI0015A6FA6A|nr:hypothetical protein [Nitrosovibrio sp. Nv17]